MFLKTVKSPEPAIKFSSQLNFFSATDLYSSFTNVNNRLRLEKGKDWCFHSGNCCFSPEQGKHPPSLFCLEGGTFPICLDVIVFKGVRCFHRIILGLPSNSNSH